MSTADTSSDARAYHASEGPALIHVWDVDPEREAVAVRGVESMVDSLANEPGLVSARVFQSNDKESMAVVVEMRSVEDRRRIEQLPAVRDTLDHLEGTVNVVARLYCEVEAVA
jgi:hypothetical protein